MMWIISLIVSNMPLLPIQIPIFQFHLLSPIPARPFIGQANRGRTVPYSVRCMRWHRTFCSVQAVRSRDMLRRVRTQTGILPCMQDSSSHKGKDIFALEYGNWAWAWWSDCILNNKPTIDSSLLLRNSGDMIHMCAIRSCDLLPCRDACATLTDSNCTWTHIRMHDWSFLFSCCLSCYEFVSLFSSSSCFLFDIYELPEAFISLMIFALRSLLLQMFVFH